MIKVTYYGHSNVFIESGDTRISIDPFFSDNPFTPQADLKTIMPDYIIVTHAHSDHLGDTVPIAKHSHALVLSNFEIINRLKKSKINCHALYISGTFVIPHGWIKFFPAAHGSSFEDGSYGGLAMSVMINIDGKNIFHAGDTGLTCEFKGIGELYTIDLALIPVGGNYTMDTRDAAIAAKWLHAQNVIPIHFNTWDTIRVNESQILEHVNPVAPVHIVKIGNSYTME